MRLVRLFLAFGVLLVFGWSSGASAVPIQWTVAEGGNGHWYDVVGEGFSGITEGFYWNDARADAEARGGYLATPTSASEWSFIQSQYATWGIPNGYEGNAWLGGFQNTASPSYSEPLGGWEWVTGEPWSYTAWNSPQQPDDGGGLWTENYLITWANPPNLTWNDLLDESQKYIIEYDTNPIPEPNTALLLGLGLAGIAIRKRR